MVREYYYSVYILDRMICVASSFLKWVFVMTVVYVCVCCSVKGEVMRPESLGVPLAICNRIVLEHFEIFVDN